MLSKEAPTNNPNNPPQLDMNDVIVLVAERSIEMKCGSLNDITTLLLVLCLYVYEKESNKYIFICVASIHSEDELVRMAKRNDKCKHTQDH